MFKGPKFSEYKPNRKYARIFVSSLEPRNKLYAV